jgi:hypothetical protein
VTGGGHAQAISPRSASNSASTLTPNDRASASAADTDGDIVADSMALTAAREIPARRASPD